ncbi:MAG: TIGR00725 family protein [Anaerolineaceae bacterium]|nr:MAG: TIGR00725 family protein [Anaerolineaceae bacterium]
MSAPVVSVVGSAVCTSAQAGIAEEVGRLLGERGAILVCGGRGGVMEAACRGAQEAGGITVGILPGIDRQEANPYLTVALPTGLGNARNTLVVITGEAVIAIGGGYGTLSEIGIALKQGRRVIGLDTWEAIRSDGQKAAIEVAQSPEQAVALALSDHL